MIATVSAEAQHMNAKDAPCRDSVVTSDMAECFSSALEKSDKELNRFYQRVQTVVVGEELLKLKATQRLWVQFRDSNCDAEYELYSGDSAGPVVKLACLEAVTRHRTEELKVMYRWRLEKFEK
jgi:uncharacterized protein YecT (DUF1311 family)